MVSVETQINQKPAQNRPELPETDFLHKGIWEMTNAEMWARVQLEALTPDFVKLLFALNGKISDPLLTDAVYTLQKRARRILAQRHEIKGELEDEDGIGNSSNER